MLILRFQKKGRMYQMTKYLREIEKAPDKEKFRCIYEQYYKLLYCIAYEILHNEEDAEDAVQETFMRIVQNLFKISDPICPETKNFVVIICKNVAFTMLKKKKREKVEELADYYPDERHHINPQKVCSDHDTIRIVVQAILELSDRYRDCLYMELVQELGYQEIASVLGEKPETVRKRIQRGKKQLRKKLEERGVTYED